MELDYNGTAVLRGELHGRVRATTEVGAGDRGAVEEIVRLTAVGGGTLGLQAEVRGSGEAFAAETLGPAQRAFPLIRTSSGPDWNRRNNAIYDRRDDWMLEFPFGVAITPEAGASGAAFTVSAAGASIRLVFRPRFYQKHRHLDFYQPWTYTVWPDPVAGWSSWWAYQDSITEAEARQVATLFAAKLRDYGYRYIQLDDGYHPRDGYPADWLRTNAKFPSGLAGWARWLRAQGLEPAIWENVQIDDAELAAAHPGWFLAGPGGGGPRRAPWVGYGIDGSNPAAVDAIIRPTYRALREMGYTYVKVDTLRHLLYDAGYPDRAALDARGSSPELAFRNVLRAVREELGPRTYLLACWGVLPEVAGIANGVRLGTDGFGPATLEQYNSFNNVVWRNDPDHVDIGGAGEDVIRPVLVSMAGAQLLLSDPAAVYENDAKLAGARRSAPVLFTLPGQLYDYDPRATDSLRAGLRNRDGGANPGPIDAERLGEVCPWWLMDISRGFGRWSVLARLSWSPLAAAPVRFADLGLDPGREYLVYEFWSRHYLGSFRGSFVAPAQAAKAASVYAIRERLDRPQIVSTNRHITQGGVDLDDVRWSPEREELAGESTVVAGDRYRITLRVPAGYRLREASMNGRPAEVRGAGEIVSLAFTPKENGRIAWSARFRK